MPSQGRISKKSPSKNIDSSSDVQLANGLDEKVKEIDEKVAIMKYISEAFR